MASFELLSWMIPFSSRSPCCIRARFSMHPCNSFRSAAVSELFTSFLRAYRLCILPFEFKLPSGSGEGCLYGSEEVALKDGSDGLKGSLAVR